MSERLPDAAVLRGDTLAVLPTLPESSIHACVADPPYGANFMGEDWDNFRRRENENDVGRDDVGGRLSAKAPASGAETDTKRYQAWCEQWARHVKRVLKPGGHLIAFSGNRTHHRLMVGVEDAGFEIRDTITWHFGEGLPKGASLSTWLEGADAEKWGDWRGTLKPATEFAVLARAPLSASSATQNQVEHGVGNLNIEAARLPTGGDHPNADRDGEATATDRYTDDGSTNFATQPGPRGGDPAGRYPPTLALDPTMAGLLDAQTSGTVALDDHGVSRFFYCAKASQAERTHNGAVENDHPTVKPLDLMEWLVQLVTAEGQTVLDPFAGSGTTLLAAERTGRTPLGIERDRDHATTARNRLAALEVTDD